MKKLFIFCSILLLSVASTQAQAKHESVIKLIKLMQSDVMVDKIFDSMTSTIAAQAQSEAKDEASKAKAKEMTDTLLETIKGITKRMINEDMVAIYEKYFTEQDIQNYIKFYETPSGQKMIQLMPDMQKEMVSVMMTKYMPEMKAAMEKKSNELKTGNVTQ